MAQISTENQSADDLKIFSFERLVAFVFNSQFTDIGRIIDDIYHAADKG
ncbi:MAG: hypothetical protein PHQ67_11050 [Fermentimonas sp.]|nr:hypothetical protein [Fermentimonas sp.]